MSNEESYLNRNIEVADQMVEAGAEALKLGYGLDGEPMNFLRQAAEATYQAMRPLKCPAVVEPPSSQIG